MLTTFRFDSATELTVDVIEAIKVAFKSKAITITVTEEEHQDDTSFFMNRPIDKEILLKSIEQDKNNQMTKNVNIEE
jgi:hypothetical protein